MHKVVGQIKDLLTEKDIPFTYMEHKEAITAEEMAEIREDYTLEEGGKALIVKAGDEFVQLVLTGESTFSNSKVRKLLNCKDVRFATEEELDKITDGVVRGAVPPFGNLFSLKVFVDEKVNNNKRIVFNCGSRGASIAMDIKDYISVVQPEVVDISK